MKYHPHCIDNIFEKIIFLKFSFGMERNLTDSTTTASVEILAFNSHGQTLDMH